MDAASAPSAPASAKAVKAPRKKAAAKPKGPSAHPQYKVMVAASITALKERGGSSRQAILKYIIANYKVGNNPTAINARVKAALKAGVKTGNLKQSKGTGAAGSFRLGEKSEKKATKPKSPKKAAKPKKPAGAKKAKSPKKAATKKPAAAKKPKSHKKAAAAKPKKPKSPKKAAAAKPKKPKTPKKPKATKPKAAKKPAVKKAKAPKKAAAAK